MKYHDEKVNSMLKVMKRSVAKQGCAHARATVVDNSPWHPG
jgi:hypothetical protein